MARMKAMVLTRFGGPDAFEPMDVPVPVVGPRQLRVRVMATAINPLDCQIRRGDYVEHVPLPAIIGHDVSGVVDEVGAGVSEFAVGDEVYYTPKIFGGNGSYAQWHVVDADIASLKPSRLSHPEAASLTLVGGTVIEALLARARLRIGETILIHGGAGGVGSIAIQLARSVGARIIVTARSRDRDFLLGLGADAVIDYATEDYVSAIALLTDGAGVDVVLDCVGGDTLARSPHVLAPLGRVVTLVDTAQPQDLLAAWGRNLTYHFVFTRQSRGKLDQLTNLIERGHIRPVVGAVLPFNDIPRAHELLDAGIGKSGIKGKIVIDLAA